MLVCVILCSVTDSHPVLMCAWGAELEVDTDSCCYQPNIQNTSSLSQIFGTIAFFPVNIPSLVDLEGKSTLNLPQKFPLTSTSPLKF